MKSGWAVWYDGIMQYTTTPIPGEMWEVGEAMVGRNWTKRDVVLILRSNDGPITFGLQVLDSKGMSRNLGMFHFLKKVV